MIWPGLSRICQNPGQKRKRGEKKKTTRQKKKEDSRSSMQGSSGNGGHEVAIAFSGSLGRVAKKTKKRRDSKRGGLGVGGGFFWGRGTTAVHYYFEQKPMLKGEAREGAGCQEGKNFKWKRPSTIS